MAWERGFGRPDAWEAPAGPSPHWLSGHRAVRVRGWKIWIWILPRCKVSIRRVKPSPEGQASQAAQSRREQTRQAQQHTQLRSRLSAETPGPRQCAPSTAETPALGPPGQVGWGHEEQQHLEPLPLGGPGSSWQRAAGTQGSLPASLLTPPRGQPEPQEPCAPHL